jgi:hypothetical protein
MKSSKNVVVIFAFIILVIAVVLGVVYWNSIQSSNIIQNLSAQTSASSSPNKSLPETSFSVTPTSGIAGRNVITLASSYGGKNGSTAGYFIDWGDNTLEWFSCGEPITDEDPVRAEIDQKCLPSTTQHTYINAGTYKPSLNKIIDLNKPFKSKEASSVVGYATVTITGINTLPPPTCVLTASPSTATIGQKIHITWMSQNASSEYPAGYGSWAGLGGDGQLLYQLVSPTSFNGSQTIIAKGNGAQTLNLAINGPGGNGEGSCSVVVTVTGN